MPFLTPNLQRQSTEGKELIAELIHVEEKELEEEGKKLLSLDDSLKKAKTTVCKRKVG